MKFEIKSRLNGSVLFSLETESLKLCIESAIKAKADLRSANLSYADLSSANLNSANLSYADLRSANLSYANLNSADLRSANLSYANLNSVDLRSANLRSADLSSANLNSANLRSANLDKRYIQVSCIGSRKGMTTYCIDDDKIWCGCFTGTMQEFKDCIETYHKDNPQYLAEYRAAVMFFGAQKTIYEGSKK